MAETIFDAVAGSVNGSKPRGYGTPQYDVANYFVCPSDGVITVSYGMTDTGYCYVNIGNSPQFFTSKDNTNGGLTFVYPAFAGNTVIYTRTKGNVNFIPFTY